ncbi:MAG: 50S ribosomal protein L4 [Rickettsiaceae bacterium]|nr:50S ribosomal protein L4 [Rickettsiaceae bacterium]
MTQKLYDLDKNELGDIEVDPKIFGLEQRPDIIKRVVDWQLAKRRDGNHLTKTISAVSGTTKKPHSQKGTGKARQGSKRQVHMRGGAVSHGPVLRSHEFKLNKKVRSLGLRHAISIKAQENKIFIINDLQIAEPKTSALTKKIKKFGFKSYFVIDGENLNENFKKASSSLYFVNGVPQIGANVYDILKHDCLIISKSGLEQLSERLKK